VAPSPWSFDPNWDEVAFVLVLCVSYAWSVRRFGAPHWRLACFGAGVVLVLAAVVSPIATVALHYLVSAHLLQNVMLAEWAPALLVVGVAAATASRVARLPGFAVLTYPLVALPLWILLYAAWHIPAAYDAALRHGPLLRLQHLSYLLFGVLLWWPVFQRAPHRLANGTKALYVFGAFLFASPLGLLLALLPSAIYDFYAEAPRLWGLDALTDQQIAGVIMAGSEAAVFFAIFAVYVLRWLADEEAATPAEGRQDSSASVSHRPGPGTSSQHP
jgi:cytochrome c oxidase assembly factor CtaG